MSLSHLNFFFSGTKGFIIVFLLDLGFEALLSAIFVCARKTQSEIRMRDNNSSPVYRDESIYMKIFIPARRASPVATAETSAKRAGPPSRAWSCNRKVENIYNLYSKRDSPENRAGPVNRASTSM